MSHHELRLDPEPAAALSAIRQASRGRPVLVFKRSPVCSVSARAERALRSFLASLQDDGALALAEIDVIEERPLARGLTAELDLRHESPQALWFEDGELRWHGSHSDLTAERFASLQRGEA